MAILENMNDGLSRREILLLFAASRLTRDTLAAALSAKMRDWEVMAPEDVPDAVQRLTQAPRVALLDIGADLRHLQRGSELRAQWPELPILVLEHRANEASVRLVLSLDLTGYVTREQTLPTLVGSIEEVAQGRRVFAPEIAARLRVTAEGLRLTDDESTPWSKLTSREVDVLILIAQGNSVVEAAKLLGIRPATVDNHKTRLMHKLNIHKATQLAAWAVSVGLVSPMSGTFVRGSAPLGSESEFPTTPPLLLS